MSLTSAQKTLIRNAFGFTTSTLTEENLDALIAQIEVDYPAASSSVHIAATKLELCIQLANASGSDVDYELNEQSEKLSQRAEHWRKMIPVFQDELDKAIRRESGAGIRVIKNKRVPTRKKSYPSS